MADFGALALSLLSAINFLLGGYNEHAKNDNMLTQLYGYAKMGGPLSGRGEIVGNNNHFAKKVLKQHISARIGLHSSYWSS